MGREDEREEDNGATSGISPMEEGCEGGITNRGVYEMSSDSATKRNSVRLFCFTKA